MSWSAKQYTAFEDERTRPVRDLLAGVPTREAHHAVDLGCGPGNSTELLMARFPAAEILGVDSSDDMIAAAHRRLPRLHFEQADISGWQAPCACDAILANAVLQWVPDHKTLLPRLMAMLAPGGSLAIQVPDNLDEPAHALMRQVAADGPWAGRLAQAAQARGALGSAEWYFTLLRPLGRAVDVWRTTYHHPLAGGIEAVIEWFKGSGLRPFLDALEATERAAYLDAYRSALAEAYPVLADGTVLLPFPRLFVVATI